jgi:hypothetical protein
VRAESHFGTDIEPAQVFTGPAEDEKQLSDNPEDIKRLLWQIRRQRESDPEFKRLIATSGTFDPRQ